MIALPTIFLVEVDLVVLLVAMKEPVRTIDAGDTAQKGAGEMGEGVEPKSVDNDTCLPREKEQQDGEPRMHLAQKVTVVVKKKISAAR